MFGKIIDFNTCCKKEQQIDFLYQIFKYDFIDNKCYIANKIFIDPQSNKKRDGKEKVFWHIITKNNPKTKKREFDKQRASRIKWIRKIIDNYNNTKIKLFYHYEEKQKAVRLYLWVYEYNFIVIIQKLGKTSSYLVTSFYIDKHYNKKIYQKRYEAYINRVDNRLNGCEWF